MNNNKCLYNTSKMNFNNITDDIHIYIMNFLVLKEICVMASVNKTMNNIAECNLVWKYYIDKYNINLLDYDIKYNYKYIISNIISNIKQNINNRKEENNNKLIYITSNIYRFNYIIKKIYIQNKYKHQNCKFNNELTTLIILFLLIISL